MGRYLDIFGYIWAGILTYLDIFGYIWAHLDIFGHVFGHCQKTPIQDSCVNEDNYFGVCACLSDGHFFPCISLQTSSKKTHGGKCTESAREGGGNM